MAVAMCIFKDLLSPEEKNICYFWNPYIKCYTLSVPYHVLVCFCFVKYYDMFGTSNNNDKLLNVSVKMV